MDGRKDLTFSDGCAQWFFEERMRARVGVSPGCAQPTWRMRATPQTRSTHKSDNPSPGHTTSSIGVKVVWTFNGAGPHVGSCGLIDFFGKIGMFSRWLLSLQALHLETTQTGSPPRGGKFYNQSWVQPIPPAVTFSKARCKARIWSSQVSSATLKWKQTSELWLRALLQAFWKCHRRWLRIAFITCNSNLVPLLEGLCSSNPLRFEFSVFWVFARMEPKTSGFKVPRSDQLS